MTTWRCNRLNLPYLEKHRASCHAILKNLPVTKGLGILRCSLKAFCVKFEILSAVYLWNWYPDFMSLVIFWRFCPHLLQQWIKTSWNLVKFFSSLKKEEEFSQFSRVLSGMYWCHSKYFFVLNEIFIFPTSASTCGGLLRRTMRLSFGLERRHLFLFVLQTH